MAESTEQTVSMKCEKCGYTENVPLKDILFLRKFSDPGDNEDHILCPVCLGDMYRLDSDHSKK